MPDRKHIVILGSAHPLRGGGLATFNERLAREFQHHGHKVTIYTFALQYPSLLFPGKSQYSEESPPVDLDIRVKVNSINPINWIKIGNELRKLKPDLLIVRYWIPFMAPCLGTICHLVRGNQHTRVICVVDNIVPHEKRLGDQLLTRYFLPSVHAFITMSQIVSKDLMNIHPLAFYRQSEHPLYDNFGDRISQEEARRFLGIPLAGKLLLFFGFIRSYKGLDILLDAMADPWIKAQDIKLLIAGEFYQDDRPYLEQIQKLGLVNKVIIHPHFIADQEVKYYCCAADFIIQPYKHATQSGVTPLAYHFEIPMIVTNVGGLPDMVKDGETGLVAEPQRASIAEHIKEAIEKGKDQFMPGLLTFKQQFSWKKMMDSILELSDEVLR